MAKRRIGTNIEKMREEMRLDIATAIEQSQREAMFIAETPAMDRFFEDQVPKITEEQKQGIGTEDGYGIFIVPKVAKGIAKRRFIDGSVNVARRGQGLCATPKNRTILSALPGRGAPSPLP